MKFKYHELGKTDSLESIASLFGANAHQVRHFHNMYADLNDLIGDVLPKHLTQIIIPVDGIYLDLNTQTQSKNNQTISLEHINIDTKYQISLKIDMIVKNSSLIDSETEMVWGFSKRVEKDLVALKINQLSHQIKYVKSMYRPLLEYMKKFNKPLENLIVELNENGEIKKIINQDEIHKNWEVLKEELKNEMGNTEEEKKILQGGDKDFSDSMEILNNNLLYQIFFPAVYSKEFVSDQKFEHLENGTYTSQIFSFAKIKTATKRKIEKASENLSVKFLTESQKEPNDEVINIYNSKLKEFLNKDLDYKLNWTTEYLFDLKTSKLKNVKSKIKEFANDQYIHTTEFDIIETI